MCESIVRHETACRLSPTLSLRPCCSWEVQEWEWPRIRDCCSVAQSCWTLWNPMNCSTPGFPVLHHLPGFAQIHIHWVGDAIQPSCSLSSLFPPAFNLSQHQGLFQWPSSLQQVAKLLELQPQHQSLQCIFRIDFLYDGLVWSPFSPRDSRESSPIPQFKNINSLTLSLLSNHRYLGSEWKKYTL